ncbi:MAG: hypothetical protein GDA45_07535 [Chromatiales bacterium]|nr:hypothetical protein [Chromatiales bacterium]
MKCVYSFWHNQKCVINGQGNVSRFEVLKNALETGKMQRQIHNKVFVLLLLRKLYGKDAITYEMQLTDTPVEDEKVRHNMWGGNVGNFKNAFDEMLEKHHPSFKDDYPEAYFVMSSWAMHGDGMCLSRCNVAEMPKTIKDGIELVLGDIV